MRRYVYFIRPVGENGPVKIGCSINPRDRVKQMTRRNRPLELVAALGGDFFEERQFHTLFAADHIGKEWFFWTPALGEVMDAIAAGDFDRSILPDTPKRLPRKAIEYTPERRARMAEASRNHNRWLKEYRSRTTQTERGVSVSFDDLAESVRAA